MLCCQESNFLSTISARKTFWRPDPLGELTALPQAYSWFKVGGKGIEKGKGRWLGGERKDVGGPLNIFYMALPMFGPHQRQTCGWAALILSLLGEWDQVKIAHDQHADLPDKPSVVEA
jgi:hypothetical protein